MNSRRTRQVTEAAGPLLAPGERIDVVGLAKVGSVSVKRQVLTTALVGALTAGTVIATVQPRPLYWVITDQRLLFLDCVRGSGKPGKPLMSMPREAVTAAPLSAALLGLGLKTMLTVEGQEQALKMVFPPALKADGRAFAARIGVARL